MNKTIKICAIGIIMLTCSCGGGGGSSTPAVGDPAPVVYTTNVSPTTIVFTGGTVNVSAEIRDNNAVTSVNYELTSTAGTTITAATQSGDDWSATLTLPVNESTSNQDQVYSIVIKASDANGNTTSAPAVSTVTVESMLRPPEPPTFP